MRKKPSQRSLRRGPVSGEALGSPTASDQAILGKDQNLMSYGRWQSNGDGLAMVSHKRGSRCSGREGIQRKAGLTTKGKST
eukprot:6204026-Pleurochrysis_carterae.AAC.1